MNGLYEDGITPEEVFQRFGRWVKLVKSKRPLVAQETQVLNQEQDPPDQPTKRGSN